MSDGVYVNDWATSGEAGMLSDFGIDKAALDEAEVLFASYTYEDYSGDAYVLFKRGDKLFEVHGGHCSCYGLSEQSYSGGGGTQWQPEEVDAASVLHRLNHGSWGEADQIKERVRAALASSKPGAM